MNTASELEAGYAAHDAAAVAHQEAEERLAEVERQAAERRRQLRREPFQDWLTAYQPKHLRDGVRQAERRYVEDPCTTNELAVLAAVRRERLYASFALEAANVEGAVTPDGQPVDDVDHGHRDGDGNQLPEDLTEAYPVGHPARTLVAQALKSVAEELQLTRDLAALTAATVAVRPPTGYRVEVPARAGDDWDDVIGGAGVIQFRGGVAYAMSDAIGDARVFALVRYWRTRPEAYVIAEVYGSVPQTHVQALRRAA